MKEDYSKPVIVSCKDIEGAIPAFLAAASAFAAGVEAARQIRNAMSDARPLQSLGYLQLCQDKTVIA